MSGGDHDLPGIQHHYDDAQHQFDSGKLGIWVFLAQEILFFSALFVAYIIYRAHHPEIFFYAHHYLDVKWGAINTLVLISSSLTAAWAVRCAQLEQRRGLIITIIITILCACAFMGIKYVEYSHKIHDGILFGEKFQPKYDRNHVNFPTDKDGKPQFWAPDLEKALEAQAEAEGGKEGEAEKAGEKAAKAEAAQPAAHGGEHGEGHGDGVAVAPPPNTNMFFTIYFAMTGLHGIHVLVGIGIFIWLLIRAIRGDFHKRYFGPIDYAALYWHLVDLIWIYLFPLLYLIS